MKKLFFLSGLIICFFISSAQIDNNLINKSIDNLNCSIVTYYLVKIVIVAVSQILKLFLNLYLLASLKQ